MRDCALGVLEFFYFFILFQPYAYLWLTVTRLCKKKKKKRRLVVIPQQVSISEQSPFFSVLAICLLTILWHVSLFLPHAYSQQQIWFHHNWVTKAIVPIRHQLNKFNKLMHGGSTLTHATCPRPRMNKQERPLSSSPNKACQLKRKWQVQQCSWLTQQPMNNLIS